MKKLIMILFTMLTALHCAKAQNEQETASQQANLVMSNAIDISFTSTNNSNGGTVSLAFNSVNDFANGVESASYQVKVRSNKRFRIQARTSSSRFSYSGTTTPAPQMNVSNILFLKVTNNNTGGSVSSNFNNKFRSLSSSNQTVVNNCTPGGDNTINVQYRATPGFAYPAGTYSVNVIYTATQL